MGKLCTGFDIGTGRLKMAVCDQQGAVSFAMEEMPDGLVRGGRVTSFDAMSDVIKDAARKHGVRTKDCALVLHDHDVLTRRITMPAMTEEELRLNLPFEFRDYIADEKEKYRFDYAVLGMREDESGTPVDMDLIACAALVQTIDDYAAMMRRAGFRLKKAAPAIMAYMNIISEHRKGAHSAAAPAGAPGSFDAASTAPIALPANDFCFLDIGYASTKAYLFPGGNYEVTRVLDFGVGKLADAVADAFSIEPGIARTYLASNYEQAQEIQPCLDLYEQVSNDIARIVSFFSFNYPESNLQTLYCCGSGSVIEPLRRTIASHLAIGLSDVRDLMPVSASRVANVDICPAAVGITLR